MHECRRLDAPPRFPTPRYTHEVQQELLQLVNPLGWGERDLTSFRELRETVGWHIQKYPKGADLSRFTRYIGFHASHQRVQRLKLGFPKLRDLMYAMPDLVRIEQDDCQAEYGGYRIFPTEKDADGEPLYDTDAPFALLTLIAQGTPLAESDRDVLRVQGLPSGEGASEEGSGAEGVPAAGK